MQTAPNNIMVTENARDSTTLEPIDSRNKHSSTVMKPKRAKMPPAAALKNRMANKSVDDSMRNHGLGDLPDQRISGAVEMSNTMKNSSVDPEGTT